MSVIGQVLGMGARRFIRGIWIVLTGTWNDGARQINAALSNTANSGDANTDALITALKDIIIAHGLGAVS